jgi:aspartate/methionine/tyrosine aminotransferase
VLLVPGAVFGPTLDSYVRLGFGAADTETLANGLDRVADALDAARSRRSA